MYVKKWNLYMLDICTYAWFCCSGNLDIKDVNFLLDADAVESQWNKGNT